MAFIDLEANNVTRRWADYDEDESLPEILFGVKIEPPKLTRKITDADAFSVTRPIVPPKAEEGWTTVTHKKSTIRRAARVR